MTEPQTAENGRAGETPKYTGIVCRRCGAPVARTMSDPADAIGCPACGHQWVAPPLMPF